MLSPSSRYTNIPYKGKIDSQQLSSSINGLVSDISMLLNAVLQLQDYINNSMIYGFTLSYDTQNLIVSSTPGYLMQSGVQKHYTPTSLTLSEALTAGDAIYIDTVSNTLTNTANSSTTVLGTYVGNGFDYSARPSILL